MKTLLQYPGSLLLMLLALISVINSTFAQEVVIPDPGLNAAIRQTLNKPVGALTETDMLGLTSLNAGNRNISNLAGLEKARNLNTLLLFSNHLTNFSLPSLTNLVSLDLSINLLTNVALPGGMTKLFSLLASGNPLRQLVLPAGLTGLEELNLQSNQLTSFDLPADVTGLGFLDLGFNALTNLSLPSGLTNLDLLRLSGNALTNINVPTGLTRLPQLYLDQNQLTSFTLPAGMTNLHVLDLSFNQLTNLNLPANPQSLISLNLSHNQFTSLNLPTNLTRLVFIHLRSNQLTNFSLPAELTKVESLDLSTNQLTSITLPAGHSQLSILALYGNNLTSFTLPPGLTNLIALFLGGNQLTNVVLPSDLGHLNSLDLSGNLLSSFTVPAGLTNLFGLYLSGNQLTTITLPPDLNGLGSLGSIGNPLTTLVLPEFLAKTTTLASELLSIRRRGVQVFTYPLTIQLAPTPQSPIGAFRFTITGPPGDYTVLSSTNLTTWSVLGPTQLPLGAIIMTDTTAQFSARKFYRAVRQTPSTSMVFIPPNTFTMGSPDGDVGRQADEGPQTVVTLTRGYWIGKYEVTQGEFLAVTGENFSDFPGDLNRPVEIVSFLAATNYCFLLTAQDRAAGRIPLGSHYRLPTEAEWECAARAGTSTRFSYGDDPDLTGLSNFAWFGTQNGITTHPVGQKLPNAWGLYDMEGNVWEWCQDWYGPYPGGSVIDPQGVADPRVPGSNPFGFKVIRGGAWESSEFDCRSASRWYEVAYPFVHDFRIGFRVVLVTEPQ